MNTLEQTLTPVKYKWMDTLIGKFNDEVEWYDLDELKPLARHTLIRINKTCRLGDLRAIYSRQGELLALYLNRGYAYVETVIFDLEERVMYEGTVGQLVEYYGDAVA